jgi:hypothetical protein
VKRIIIISFLLFSSYNIVKGQTLDSVIYFKSLPNFNKSYLTNFKLGKLYYDLGVKKYNELYSISGDSLASHYPVNIFDSALYFLNSSIKLNKKYAPAFYYRGLTVKYYDRSGIKDLNKAIQLDPNNSLYYYARATDNFPEKPLLDIERAIKLDSTNYEFYVCRAQIKSSNSFPHNNPLDLPSIESDLKLALNLKCDSSVVLFCRALNRRYYKDYSGALNDLNIVIRLSPLKREAYLERAEVRCLQNKYEQSCAEFKRARELGYTGWSVLVAKACGIQYWQNKK